MFPKFPLIGLCLLFVSTTSVIAAEPKDKDRVGIAIQKGRMFLQKLYDPRGKGPPRNELEGLMELAGFHGLGQGAVSGLAMLESGVPANDPSVVTIANALRLNAINTSTTYEVSLIIMFLDRLGSPDDAGLIQFMTFRLLTGQCADGTWSYDCSGLQPDPVEVRRLTAALVKPSRVANNPDKLTTPGNPPVKGKRDDLEENPTSPKPKEKTVPKVTPSEEIGKLHPILQRYAKLVNEGQAGNARPGSGDHSNTQFASIALWCGRRHHVNTEKAFKLLEKHYRDCQGTDGGWSYTGAAGGSSPAMTCAGLIGLATGFGSKQERLTTKDGGGNKLNAGEVGADKAIENGLKMLGTYLATAAQAGNGRGQFQPNELTQNLYFMWSLERVAMIYGLQTIGKIDWYEWGSESLLKVQNLNGSWSGGNYHGSSPELDTAFALLFLSRANLAQDLSASLKGKVKDPGTSRLIGGGDLARLLGPSSGSSSSTKPEPKQVATPVLTPKVDPPAVNVEPKMPMPPANNDFESKVRSLVTALVDADPTQQRKLLETYRDSKGGEYTEALAQAIARLKEESKIQAREALASRLTRMKATTLSEFLRDNNKEIRRGAALAIGTKGEKSLAPELIRLLADSESMVIQSARSGLKQLSGQDFGPEANASISDRNKAVLAWKKWWDSNK